jgi:hypothetical protein
MSTWTTFRGVTRRRASSWAPSTAVVAHTAYSWLVDRVGNFLTVADGITVAEFWCVIMETLQHELQPLPPDGFMPPRALVEQCGEKHPTWPVMHFLCRRG